MDDDLIPTLICPRCGVLLRDGDGGLVCVEHGVIEPYSDVTPPEPFDGADLDDQRR